MSDASGDSPQLPDGPQSRGASPGRRRSNSPPTPTRRTPRRAERVVGAGLALIGVVIAAIAIVALQHPSGRAASTSTVGAGSAAATSARPSVPVRSATRSVVTRTPAAAPAAAVPLVVLDSSGTPGLADVAAARFRAGGWQVSSTGELSNDILSTCAYYDPNDPAAQPAASLLQQQFPAIARVKEKFPELPPGPVVVVLTAGYR